MSAPAAWILIGGLHAAAVVVGWACGWLPWGLLALGAAHALLLAGTLLPRWNPWGPQVHRLPTTGGRTVCLTIDDGPGEDTPAILDLLAAADVRAVFFLIGERAAARPDLAAAIVARGHLVGNHTHTHPAGSFWCALPARIDKEVATSQQVIAEACGMAPAWFRPPAGFRNPLTPSVLRARGLHAMAWTARGFDNADASIPRVLSRLRRGLVPGAILLVHQGLPHHLPLLRELLGMLRSEGWQVVLPPAPGADCSCQAAVSTSP